MCKRALATALVLAIASIGAIATAAAVRGEEQAVRDPMQPFGAVSVSGAAPSVNRPRFAVTGVLIAPTRRVAFVNGQPRKVGDVVDGAEIVAIEAGAVRLRENGSELVLSLDRRASVRDPIVQGDTVP